MIGAAKALLRWAGKGDRKVAAVFGFAPEACHSAVVQLRKGAPEVPVWLFSTAQPLAETARLCERVCTHPSSLVLLLLAQVRLWPSWVAISVATWTGGHGRWPVKLAPFLIPPFKALILNRHGGFFAGTPALILIHVRREIWGAIHSGWNRVKDVSRGVWLLASYHVWRSGPVTRLKDISISVSLWLAATVLRWLGYPDRILFRRLHGCEPLSPPHILGGTDGLVRFNLKRSRWNTAKLEQFLLSTDARWIVLQAEGLDDSVEDMLPLFEDARTFAVSRQMSYRGWKPGLFAMAPFRTLQLGEASQVLAPLSSTILVDRLKLVTLGVPRTSLTETAWMLLFWKAAAAGWRCYSTASCAALSRQPDFPVHERAFILKVLSNPALRALGPRQADLGRGNVAFVPSARSRPCSESGRLRVLLVSPFLPYPLSHGGAVRIYNLCRQLAGQVDFALVTMRETQDVVAYDRLHDVFQRVYVVDRDEPMSADRRLPRQVREHESRSLRALIAELGRDWKPHLIQVEYTHMAAFRDAAPEIPAILVEHDLTFTLYRQLAQTRPSGAARAEYQRWLEFERSWLEAYDAVWTVSGEDRETAILEGRRRPEFTFAVPNGVDTGRFVPGPEPEGVAEILYVGSFRHLPNILGFEKLRVEVMPRAWQRLPDVRLRVVAGPEHERFWRAFGGSRQQLNFDPRIEVHGFVEDLRPLYARASVVAVPLEVSAGTNIKVLEAMACGKAVVTTPPGCGGLGLVDGHDGVIRPDWPSFTDSLIQLLSDAPLRQRLGKHARRTAEERFSWTAIAGSAQQSYRALLTAAGAAK
jgi:polysaccharide biosynthesis protein PslH